MSTRDIVILLIILALIFGIPAWPHSRSWGWGPFGGLGGVLVILLILWFLGVI